MTTADRLRAQNVCIPLSLGRLAADELDTLTASLDVAQAKVALPDCPTCGGSGVVRGMNHTSPAELLFDCPDCDHGKVTVARLAATWQAVHEFEFRELQWGDEYDAGAQAAIEQVREVAKAVRP